MLVKTLDPLVFTLGMEEEGIRLLEVLCKKVAYMYTIEIFYWQNMRDVLAKDVIPLTDERFVELMASMKYDQPLKY